MADANNIDSGVETQVQEAEVKTNAVSPEQVIALQDELAATKANLEKARRGEKFNQSKRVELEEQLKGLTGEDFKVKYEAASTELEQLKGSVKNQLIDSVLKDELTKANAKSISTVMKLVDRSKINVADGQVDTKSIEALIEELKKTDAVLFQEVQTPAVKRTGETTPIASFKTEMTSAKTPAEVQKVLAKYGMGSTI